MAAFLYRAVDPEGRNRRGVIDAGSAAQARAALRAKKLLPLSVEPARTRAAPRRLPVRALTLVTRQLATLFRAGVRVEDALATVAAQARPAVTPVLLNLRAAVLDGTSFADALAQYPESFAEDFRASVRAGEAAGQLGEVMEHLASDVAARARNRQKIQLALLYPALLALVSLGVVIALLAFVVPDIVRVFTTRGADLPWLTRQLIGLSAWMTAWGLWALLVLGALLAGAAALLRRPGPRLAWHRALARAPGLGALVRGAAATQYAGTLATLVQSRVPLTEALAAATDTVGNRHLRATLASATEAVREGGALAPALAATGALPPMMIAMVASGEASGRLGESLARAAEDQARDLDAILTTLVGLVEPGVLLVMGGIVMLLVLSILLPIVNLNTLV